MPTLQKKTLRTNKCKNANNRLCTIDSPVAVFRCTPKFNVYRLLIDDVPLLDSDIFFIIYNNDCILMNFFAFQADIFAVNYYISAICYNVWRRRSDRSWISPPLRSIYTFV